MFVRVCCVRVCCVVHTKGQRSRNEGSRFLYHCALHAGRTALIGRYFNRWLAPPSNVPGSQLGEMAFVTVTPDVTDVFSNFPHKPACCRHCVVEGNAEK